jgi:hypothetical protein
LKFYAVSSPEIPLGCFYLMAGDFWHAVDRFERQPNELIKVR